MCQVIHCACLENANITLWGLTFADLCETSVLHCLCGVTDVHVLGVHVRCTIHIMQFVHGFLVNTYVRLAPTICRAVVPCTSIPHCASLLIQNVQPLYSVYILFDHPIPMLLCYVIMPVYLLSMKTYCYNFNVMILYLLGCIQYVCL